MSDMTTNNSNQGTDELDSDRHLTQAVVLLEDAFAFRSIGHKLSPPNVLKLYRIYWSKWAQRFLTAIVACQLLLIFVQFPSSLSRTSDLTQKPAPVTLPCAIQILIEFLCLIIFYIDGIIRVNLPFHFSFNHLLFVHLDVFSRFKKYSKKTLDSIVYSNYNGIYD